MNTPCKKQRAEASYHMKDIRHIFEKVYKEQSDAIFRFCLMRVSDREQALDITEETFLRLWQNLQKEEEILNPRAFIFTIARRLIIDWYRKKKSIPFINMENERKDEDEMGYDPSDEMTTELHLIGTEGRYLIDKINSLPETYRLPVYLRFVEDLPPSEISKILEISVNATSVRINRGLIELRKIAGYNEEKN